MKNKIKLIIFDVDGVIADVSQSYRVAIKKTAEFFLGKILDMKEVEEVKNQGGYNDDHDASEALIQKHGGDFRKEVIIKKFQEYYLGRKLDGLLLKEKCLLSEAALKKLKKYKLAVFTGRNKFEAEFVLKRFKILSYFDELLTVENVANKKPAPEGLLKITSKLKIKPEEAVYVGDNIDDAKCAKEAHVNFIGVIPPGVDKVKAKDVLKGEGVEIVLNSANEIINVLK